ncbi:unnamed protein product, partial [Symbiodinium necroappetens]
SSYTNNPAPLGAQTCQKDIPLLSGSQRPFALAEQAAHKGLTAVYQVVRKLAELQSALLHLPQGKALPPWVVWCDNMQNPMLRPYVYDLACRFPQFAYVSMRSVEDKNIIFIEEEKDIKQVIAAEVDADLIDLILHIHRHSKLLIDHKDAVVMFFRPASRMSIIPLLAKKSEHWHELKAQKDAELSLALRTFLFRSMFDAIQERLQETVKNPTQLEAAQQLQVFLPDKEGDQAPLTLERVVEILAAILKHSLDSLAILCFHPTQKLAAPIQGPTLPFLLQVGNRSKASFELYENLILLANSALWQLVGGSLRTERMSRSPL